VIALSLALTKFFSISTALAGDTAAEGDTVVEGQDAARAINCATFAFRGRKIAIESATALAVWFCSERVSGFASKLSIAA
jgi:hypothetical protein